MAKLVIFDVDHTLFSSVAKVHVKRADAPKTAKPLYTFKSQKEFETYKLKDGEIYDFSEMRDGKLFELTAVAIQPVIERLKRIIRENGKPGKQTWQVAIITARSSLRDKEKFLSVFDKEGIPITKSRHERYDPSKCHIYRAGDMKYLPSPIAKRKIIEQKDADSPRGFNTIEMYDDSKANLEEFLKIENKELRAYLVQGNRIIEYAHRISGSDHIEYKYNK